MTMLIKGMDMPQSCWECLLRQEGCCLILHQAVPSIVPLTKLDNCPLNEIVTCMDCKYCETYAVSNDTPIGRWCHRFSITKAVESDDFCSYGERRE